MQFEEIDFVEVKHPATLSKTLAPKIDTQIPLEFICSLFAMNWDGKASEEPKLKPEDALNDLDQIDKEIKKLVEHGHIPHSQIRTCSFLL
jgi:hypothetical protein